MPNIDVCVFIFYLLLTGTTDNKARTNINKRMELLANGLEHPIRNKTTDYFSYFYNKHGIPNGNME